MQPESHLIKSQREVCSEVCPDAPLCGTHHCVHSNDQPLTQPHSRRGRRHAVIHRQRKPSWHYTCSILWIYNFSVLPLITFLICLQRNSIQPLYYCEMAQWDVNVFYFDIRSTSWENVYLPVVLLFEYDLNSTCIWEVNFFFHLGLC